MSSTRAPPHSPRRSGRTTDERLAPPSPPLPPTVGSPALNISIFGVFVLITLAIVIRASRNNRSAADFYAGGRAFTGRQNGIAIAGDYLSAASFLGIAGAIALNGYDGFLYSIGFLVAWLVALLLVAELLRNAGKFTMADVLSFRLQAAPGPHGRRDLDPRGLLLLPAGPDGRRRWPGGPAARASTSKAGQSVVIAVVGVIMITYVLIGGMKGTTWVQIIKAVLLIIGAGVMTLWVLGKFGLNLSSLLGDGRRGVRRQEGARARACSTARPAPPSSTSSRCRWPWCSAPPACRTC